MIIILTVTESVTAAHELVIACKIRLSGSLASIYESKNPKTAESE